MGNLVKITKFHKFCYYFYLVKHDISLITNIMISRYTFAVYMCHVSGAFDVTFIPVLTTYSNNPNIANSKGYNPTTIRPCDTKTQKWKD